MSKLKT